MEPTTNHDLIAEALAPYQGQILATAAIEDLCVAHGVTRGAVRPNDHGTGNRSCCVCAGTANRIFEKIERGFYQVR